jgi:hypothetical protein
MIKGFSGDGSRIRPCGNFGTYVDLIGSALASSRLLTNAVFQAADTSLRQAVSLSS